MREALSSARFLYLSNSCCRVLQVLPAVLEPGLRVLDVTIEGIEVELFPRTLSLGALLLRGEVSLQGLRVRQGGRAVKRFGALPGGGEFQLCGSDDGFGRLPVTETHQDLPLGHRVTFFHQNLVDPAAGLGRQVPRIVPGQGCLRR